VRGGGERTLELYCLEMGMRASDITIDSFCDRGTSKYLCLSGVLALVFASFSCPVYICILHMLCCVAYVRPNAGSDLQAR